MEEKKNKKGLIVLFVILIILVLGLGGYLVYDKVIKKDEVKTEKKKTEDKKEEIKEINLAKDDKIVKELLIYTGNYTNLPISFIHAYTTLYSNNKTDIASISDVDKFTMARNYYLFLNDLKYLIEKEDNPIILDKDMETYINKIFGSNTYGKMNKNSLNGDLGPNSDGYISGCNNSQLVWYETKKQYEFSYECGGLDPRKMNTEFIGAKKITKNGITTIEIDLAIYFVSENEEIYSDIIVSEYKGELKNNIGNKLDINKLSKYKHTFELDKNGNYIYKTVEKISNN